MAKNDDTQQDIQEEIKEEKREKKAQKDEAHEWEEKLADSETKYKRALADYQNLEKRVRDEKGEWIKAANRELLLRMLPLLDTFSLAVVHSKDQTFSVVMQQFADVLKDEGVEKIKTVGEIFDPHHMEAIDTIEGEEGKVIEEVRPGYMLYGRLLRPAQVRVGQKASS